MPKVQQLTAEEVKRLVLKRLEACKKHREQFEQQWQENHNILYSSSYKLGQSVSQGFDEAYELESGDVDSGDSQIGMNYAFKYLRFFHSQLSANPPSVIARPTSSDATDKRKADAADRLVRHARSTNKLDELIDQQNLNMLTYGNGWLKLVWNPDKGDIYDFNDETKEVIMEGDIEAYAPAPRDVWLDPDARTWDNVRFIIERHYIPYEEAVFRFPEHKEVLKRQIETSSASPSFTVEQQELYTDHVAVYEYYEKGSPVNGMAGRHVWFTADGTMLKTPSANPHYKAGLPYHLLTYVDVPNQVYGKSIVDYVARLQDMLNRLDSQILDVLQAHTVVRMAIPEGSDIEDQALSNSAWDWVKYSGNQAPHFIPPTQLPSDPWRFREQLMLAIQDLYGVNDAMMGIQRREQSAVSQQTSIEAGTMIHRRLFKKYQLVVQQIYKDFLGLVRENWTEPRTILVLGKEKAFEVADFKGADISGGFDLDVEYGTSLPLDPNMRREVITLLTPQLKEAGMSMKAILRYMKLNDLEGLHDRAEMAAERQREIFEKMILQNIYIEPREVADHAAMLEFAYDYIMTAEFRDLPESAKQLIEKHIKDREAIQAAAVSPAGPAGPAAPAGGDPLAALLGGGGDSSPIG
jgi:hypothetical protein